MRRGAHTIPCADHLGASVGPIRHVSRKQRWEQGASLVPNRLVQANASTVGEVLLDRERVVSFLAVWQNLGHGCE